jgi:hypothetical protein
MSVRRFVAFASLVLLLTAPRVVGQTTMVAGSGGGTPLTLEGIGTADPFAAAGTDLLTGVPNPSATTAVIDARVGFSYLRPYWSGSGLELRVPGGNNPAVGVTRPYGDLSQSFGFVPRLDLTYDLRTIGVGASIQYIGLGGTLDRTVAVGGGVADLVASSNLSILTVGLVEIRKPTSVADRPLFCRLGMEDDTFVASIGTRYESIRQDYHASLRGAAADATVNATQSFNGLGLTAGLSSDHPLNEHWGLYTTNRWSLLLGLNNRKSTAAGVDAGGPFANSLTENRTTFFPAGELEVGFRYLAPLENRPAGSDIGPVLSMRVGFTGQYYNGIGFLPASPGTARFDNRPLYLVGFTVIAGVEY